MFNDKELAAIIAREIFHVGSDPGRPVRRIEFKDAMEKGLGGFSETPLADFIEKVLKKHRSY